MIKNIVRLESVINGRVGHFLLDNDCPIEAAEQMALEFLQYLGQLKAQAKAQQAASASETDIKPEIPQPEIANV